jgi:hypothetical protein
VTLIETQTIFGRIVTGADVEQWCLETLAKWSGTYLAEVERQHGITAGQLSRVRAWQTTPSLDKWPEDQLPAVLLVSVGLAERPVRDGSGKWRARWQMGLACVCSARTQAESRFNAMMHVAAHSQILLDRPSLEGRANGVDWLSEDYDTLPFDDARSLAAGMCAFTVEVENVRQNKAGPPTPSEPLDPDTLPWPLWQTVREVDVEVDSVIPPAAIP